MIALVSDLVRRTRQHHAIEHATLTLLAREHPGCRLIAVSDPVGFTVFGEVTDVALRRAVGEALLRLQAGEQQLAIHPNCGTNLATAGVLATLAVMVGAAGRHRGIAERFTTALLLVLPVLVWSRPLGLHLQTYTTLAEVSDRWVAEVRPVAVGDRRIHRVIFD